MRPVCWHLGPDHGARHAGRGAQRSTSRCRKHPGAAMSPSTKSPSTMSSSGPLLQDDLKLEDTAKI